MALLPRLRVMPMGKSRFGQQVQLLVRRGEFGSLPADIATMAIETLQATCRKQLIAALPWISSVLTWPDPPAER